MFMKPNFKNTDYNLSPYTGLTRDSWVEVGKYLLEGIFQDVKNFDDRIVDLIKNKTGIKYARTLIEDDSFGYGENLLKLTSTCHQYKRWEKLFDIANRFFELKNDKPAVLYIWGHSYEFDAFPNRWEEFEEFCKFISGRKDIIYGTNKEILLNNI